LAKAIYRKTDFIDNNISLRNLFNDSNPFDNRKYVSRRIAINDTFNRSTVGLALNPSFLKDHLKIKLNANYSNEKKDLQME
jgi:iron complex outermembrane receptor protein